MTDEKRERTELLFDRAFRIVAAVVTLCFVYRIGSSYLTQPDNMSALFLLISEAVSLLIIIIARRPKAQDFTPGHMILAMTGSFLVPLFVQAPDDKAICPTWATDIVVLFGVAWTIFAKLSLGRSFGVLAANRTIKSEGAYRFIRHPIYFGYFVMHMAFLLSHFVLINVLIFAQLYLIQSLRILHEERLLSQDAAYRDYCERTKYRFIFGLF